MNKKLLLGGVVAAVAIAVVVTALLTSAYYTSLSIYGSAGIDFELHSIHATVTMLKDGKPYFSYSHPGSMTNLGANLTMTKLTGNVSNAYNGTTYSMNTTWISIGNNTFTFGLGHVNGWTILQQHSIVGLFSFVHVETWSLQRFGLVTEAFSVSRLNTLTKSASALVTAAFTSVASRTVGILQHPQIMVNLDTGLSTLKSFIAHGTVPFTMTLHGFVPGLPTFLFLYGAIQMVFQTLTHASFVFPGATISALIILSAFALMMGLSSVAVMMFRNQEQRKRRVVNVEEL